MREPIPIAAASVVADGASAVFVAYMIGIKDHRAGELASRLSVRSDTWPYVWFRNSFSMSSSRGGALLVNRYRKVSYRSKQLDILGALFIFRVRRYTAPDSLKTGFHSAFM